MLQRRRQLRPVLPAPRRVIGEHPRTPRHPEGVQLQRRVLLRRPAHDERADAPDDDHQAAAAGTVLGILGAFPLLALGLHASPTGLLAAAFVGALGANVAGITWDTSLQTHIPEEVLSGVASIDDLLSFAAVPLGQVLGGPAAAHSGGAHVALACGIGYLLATLTAPAVWNLRTARNG